ncbi:MAG TPA: alpha/beta hydrolase [Acidobacteriaceae bacterium]
MLILAAIGVYAAMCLLFWQGQWQLVFGTPQPVHATPASSGLKYEEIRFDATETGMLQLSGWWIPAGSGSEFAGDTILFLRDGSGSLSDSIAQLRALHALGINVFAFDYRGFGSSTKIHPSEKSVSLDAEAAWQYLVATRHIDPGTIVFYGSKLGAAVAAELALRHPQVRALLLEDLQPPVLERLARDRRTRFLPMRLLFHDRFDPTQALIRLTIPKLFLNVPLSDQEYQNTRSYETVAAEPKTALLLHSAPGVPAYQDPSYTSSLESFLKKYLLEAQR